MPVFTKTANDVFAPSNSDGSARSVINQDVQVWGSEVEQSILAAPAGLVRAANLPSLNAVPGTRIGQPGEVLGGPDKGSYAWSGSAWIRVGDMVDAVLLASYVEEINAARQGKPSLSDRLVEVLNWSNSQDLAQDLHWKQVTDGLRQLIDKEVTDRIEALDYETAARGEAIDSALSGVPRFADVSASISRPGEFLRAFTDKIDGPPPALIPLDLEVVSTPTNGAVAKLVGAGVVAPINVFRIEPGRQYRVRFVLQRSIDTDDPSNDAIRLAVRWLNKDKGGVATTELSNLLDVLTSSGRIEYQFTLAVTGDSGIDASPPYGVTYFRPFIKTFGGGVTLIEVIEVTDLTLAADWSPDVSEYRREISGLVAQIQALADRVQ